jgi:hypothetical protein
MFSKFGPFKGAIDSYECLLWLSSSFAHWVYVELVSPSNTVSQCWVRPHVHWVNVECTSIYKDFTLPCQLSQCGMHQYFDEDFINPRWLSWRGVPFGINSVDREWDSMPTESLLNEKNPNLSALKILIIWLIQVWSTLKIKIKTSHASVPSRRRVILIISEKYISSITWLTVPLRTYLLFLFY